MTPERKCSFEGCFNEVRARGWCSTHWKRWRKHGDPSALPRYDVETKFWEQVEKTDSCWRWKGSTREGYGQIGSRNVERLAHRYSYELIKGPIPDGLHLDHLCRNRACVNPDHLEPVTVRENVLRGVGPSARNAKKTHCIHGHELAGANVYWVEKNGRRMCRTCRTRRDREYKARRNVS